MGPKKVHEVAYRLLQAVAEPLAISVQYVKLNLLTQTL